MEAGVCRTGHSEAFGAIKPSQMCVHAWTHTAELGSDATACRGSDTLLLLNEASALEARLLSAPRRGGGPAEGRRRSVDSGLCVYTPCGSSVNDKYRIRPRDPPNPPAAPSDVS